MRRRQTDYLELASVADQNEYYPTQQYLYLDDHSRKYALIGVIVSLAYSFTLCVLGSIVFPFGEMLSIKCTELSKTMIKLGLNISATLCAYVTGSVHATTLKWALIGDGRPGFNTNLRFFTATGGLFSVTGRITNFLYLVLSITSQASVTLVFYPISPENDSKISNILFNKPGELRVSSLALFIFGLALTCQSLLGLWAYFSVNISTWSSNPLDVAIAAYISGNIERCENRCLRPAAHMKDSGVKSIKPSSRQPSLCESDTLIGYIIVITWSGVAASGIWLTIALLLVSKLTCTSWISHSPNPLSACNLSALNPFVPTACIATTYRRSDVSPNSSLAENLCIAIVIQGYFAVVLHCGELVAALSRDEDIWRGASIHGALHTGNQLKNFWSWKMILFIVLDPFLHWILGNTVVFTQEQTGSRPMQIIWLIFGLLFVAVLTTCLSCVHPNGPQPSTFGHLQTLVNLIDEDSKTIWWGHKQIDETSGICHAGTSPKRLDPVKIDKLYSASALDALPQLMSPQAVPMYSSANPKEMECYR